MLDSRRVRYLIGGGWNTVFGYAVGVGLYDLLSNYTHLLIISTIANIIAISMAFMTYKLFVFQTKGNWRKEYFRSYLIYGNITLISMIMLWLMVDLLKIQFWIAQGFIMLITILLSYIGHARYTFSRDHTDLLRKTRSE
jgi:putative flippase GtrA